MLKALGHACYDIIKGIELNELYTATFELLIWTFSQNSMVQNLEITATTWSWIYLQESFTKNEIWNECKLGKECALSKT